MIKDIQKYVHAYSEAGLCCIPTVRGSHEGVVKWKEWVKSEARERWRDDLPLFLDGIHLACGDNFPCATGFCFLDIDSRDLANQFLEAHAGLLDTTIVVNTKRGIHVWLRYLPVVVGEEYIPLPKQINFREANKQWEVDFLANDHICPAPPSLHKSGQTYKFLNGGATFKQQLSIGIMEITDWGAWLTAALAPLGISLPAQVPVTRSLRDRLMADAVVVYEGQRDNYMIHRVGVIVHDLRADGLGLDTAIEIALNENRRKCVPPLLDDDVEDMVRRLWTKDS